MTDEYGKKCLQTENGNTDEGTLSYLIRVWGRPWIWTLEDEQERVEEGKWKPNKEVCEQSQKFAEQMNSGLILPALDLNLDITKPS